MSERKLVTVRKIAAVDPIEGADAIEVATVDGWKVVVKKGDFKPGDDCVYFEIDSFLPDGDARWQFLVDKSPRMLDGNKGHRLRTIKLRGQVSQGLVLPASEFHDLSEVHEDIAEYLRVVKWEPPLSPQLAGQAKGFFPSFIRKTDQERCQNLAPFIFGYDPIEVPATDLYHAHTKPARASRDTLYEVTLKLDGSSATFFEHLGEVGVCSRNLQLKVNEENAGNAFVKMLVESGLQTVLTEFIRSFAIQGELMGPGIQGNREGFKENHLFIYDIWDIEKQEYLSSEARQTMVKTLWNLGVDSNIVHHVPVLANATTLDDLDLYMVNDLLTFAEGPSLKHPVREGVVFKRVDGGFSFKAISNAFLLKEKD